MAQGYVPRATSAPFPHEMTTTSTSATRQLIAALARGASAAAFGAALASSVGAQGRSAADTGVPAGYRPPAGMCRVWVDGVPPQQQPAPTDCASAMRGRTVRSRVLLGDRPVEARIPMNAFNAGSAAMPSGGARIGRLAELDEPLVKRPGRGELCLDSDHDGICDDTAPAIAGCVDTNRRGRCDEPRRDVAPLIDAGAYRTGSVLGGVCIDRNHDGKCDETWAGADVCMDRDGDGKCDPPVSALVKPPEVRVEAVPVAPSKGKKKP